MVFSIPYSQEFEVAVIVGVLIDPLLLPKLQQVISADDFFKAQHREIFATIEDIGASNLDSLTVADKLDVDTREYFNNIIADQGKYLPGMGNILYYAETIKGKSRLRAGIELGRDITALCYDPEADADETIRHLENRFSTFLQQKVLDNRIDSSTEAFRDFIANLGNKSSDPRAVKTGFQSLDLMLHHLDELTVIAARPGMGKTACAINIARNVAEHRPVVIFSLEQTRDQVFERMLASEAEVGLEDIRTGAYKAVEREVSRIHSAEKRLSSVLERLHIDDRAQIPASYIASVSRQKKYEWGDLGLIVVDYLHLMQLNNKNQVDALGDAVKDLRALAKELDCPVILLSQLSRDNEKRAEGKRANKRPELSDLRSSGEIEQSADVVIFLYRDSYYGQSGLAPDDDMVEVIVKKNRSGRTGIVTMKWLPQYVKFKDY